MLYLASPYTHKEPAIQRSRFKCAAGVTARLALDGWKVFSPIVHSHPMVEFAGEHPTGEVYKLAQKDHAFWMNYDRPFMKLCDRLIVVAMLGWENSNGIAQEVAYFRNLKRPMALVSPEIITMRGRIELNWRYDITIPTQER